IAAAQGGVGEAPQDPAGGTVRAQVRPAVVRRDSISSGTVGKAAGNELARRGYSRDPGAPGDCKQVCIGLVVSRCGMPLGYERCAGPVGGEETFILCRSADRREKERAMHDRFEKRSEEGLSSLAAMARRRSMTPVQLSHRVGRLLGQNTRAAGAFKTEVAADQ